MTHDDHDDDHGDGLHEDLVRMASRRDALRILPEGARESRVIAEGRRARGAGPRPRGPGALAR